MIDSTPRLLEGDGDATTPDPPQPSLASEGEFADRYRIEGLIGRGAMGEVYRAFDRRLSRAVALKILHAEAVLSSSGRSAIRRLLIEAKTVSRLVHPNIVAIHDASEVDGVPYLALELCEGGSLRTRIEANDASRAEKLRWTSELAQGLAYAHAQGVIHRDIKPENVVLTKEGIAKIADFGIAKALADEGAGGSTSGVCGTPRYMAPEQWLERRIDGRIDQYSWALVVWEIWTGESFSRTRPSILRSSLTQAATPKVLADAIVKALAIDRAERFASMDEVIAALSDVAIDGTNTSDALSFRRRWRSRLPIAVAAFLGVIGTASFASVHLANEDGHTSPPSSRATVTSAVLAGGPDSGASAQYAGGQQLWRDASLLAAREQFATAARLDPALGAAHIRYVAVSEWTDPSAREHLNRAGQLRTSLSPKDAALLDALTPAVLDTRDAAVTLERLQRLATAYPRDFDVHAALALRFVHARRLQEALQEAAVVSAVAFGDYVAARVHVEEDNLAAVRSSLDACLRRAATSGDCMELAITIASNEGDCERAERDSRRFIAAMPDDADRYLFLAGALAGLNRSADEVRAALEQRWAREPASERAIHQCRDEGLIWAMRGEFGRADEALRACERASATEVDAYTQAMPRFLRWTIAQELGDEAHASELARAYVAASAAWSESESHDARIEGYQMLRKSGAMTRDAFVKVRDAWLDEPTPADHYYGAEAIRWYEAFAFPAVTPDDARDALAHIPRGRPLLPVTLREPQVEETVGALYELAGDPQTALPSLHRAAQACSIASIVDVTHARFLVGTIHEGNGDRLGACKAYRSVLGRWRPESGSRSARESYRRSIALRCDSSDSKGT